MKLILFAILTAAASANACPIGGDVKAPLTIEEYADFECPYCAKGAKLMEKVLKDYPGQVRVVYRNRPLPMHAHAEVAAKAYLALCKQKLSKKFHDELFAHQVDLESKGEPYLYELAASLGADIARMKKDMASSEIEQKLKDDTDDADRNAISGTPSFIVGTEKVTGAVPYEELRAVIEKQLPH